MILNKRLNRLWLILAVSLSMGGWNLTSPTEVYGQSDRAMQPPKTAVVNAQRGPRGRAREEIRQRIRMMLVWRLTEALDLTEEQSTKFFPKLNAFSDERERLSRERREMMETLGFYLRTDADEAEIDKKLEQLNQNEEDQQQNFRRFRTETRSILSARQRAQLLLTMPRFEQEMRERIQNLIRRRRPGDFPPSRPDWRERR